MTDLILFTGQSNMEGQTGILPSPNEPVCGGWEYRFLTDSLVPLAHPTGENIAFDGTCGQATHADAFLAAWQGCGSMLPDFCRAYIEESGRNAAAVQCAKGATTMHYWQKGQPVYPLLLQKFRSAEQAVLAAGETVGRRFAVLLQGESDAIEGRSQQEYAHLLTAFVRDLTDDLQLDAFFVIRVGRFTEDERDFPILRAQEQVCAESTAVMLTRVVGRLMQDPAYVSYERAHCNNEAFAVIGKVGGTNAARYFDGRPIELEDEPYVGMKS